VSRTAERQVSFADWELMRQGLRLEPLLQAISDFLDDQHDMIEHVRCDLTRGLKNAETGRSGLTPQQVLRSLVLMRIKNWNYRELRERIADGCTLRQFTDFYCLPVPRHDAFHRGFNRLTPETLKAINEVVQAAVELGLEDGQKLRVDTTVVQTDIHHPTDNTLYVGCRSRRHAPDRSPRCGAGTPAYQGVPRSDAIGATSNARDSTDDIKAAPGAADRDISRTHRHCRRGHRKRTNGAPATGKACGKDIVTDLAIAELRKEIEHFCDLGVRVIDQSRHRVLSGEQVPTTEKLY
jgi:transposase, IS5 family